MPVMPTRARLLAVARVEVRGAAIWPRKKWIGVLQNEMRLIARRAFRKSTARYASVRAVV